MHRITTTALLIATLITTIVLTSASRADSADQGSDTMDTDTARRFAQLALDCVEREYPNLIHHVMTGDDDVAPPRELTPAFYGCYDWHSAVHGHWLLARLARRHSDSDFGKKAIEALGRNLTREHLLAEAAYVADPARDGFERPYGLAWLLQRITEWIPKLAYPIRIGEHDQTAFAFGLAWDYAEQVGNAEFQDLLAEAGRRFYASDRDCPLDYEPSGHDFLSPCLAEADFMRRVMTEDRFAEWLTGFLPDIGESDWLPVARVTDRSDGKLAHLDGLNLSRAWMLQGIAAGLPDGDPRREPLLTTAERHAEAGLAGVSDAHYEGGHWLASFAVYLETERGIPPGDRLHSDR